MASFRFRVHHWVCLLWLAWQPLCLPGQELALVDGADLDVSGSDLCSNVPECYCFQSGTELRAECGEPTMDEVPDDLPENVTEIQITRTELALIDRMTFWNYMMLKDLELWENIIHTVSSDALNLQLATLEKLYLQGNRLTSFDGILTGFHKLTELDLSDNWIASIPSPLNLPAVADLKFINNQIISIPPNSFLGCPSLVDLTLEENNITQLSTGAFLGLESLARLTLSHNRIASITSGAFNGLDNIVNLYLDNNDIPSLPVNSFSGAASLATLILSHNAIANVDDAAFTELTQLQEVVLDNNLLEVIPKSALSTLSSLEYLDLRGNSLSEIPTQALAGVGQIKEVFFEEMPSLLTIQSGAFAGLPSLGGLHLGNNPNLAAFTLDIVPDAEHQGLKFLYIHGDGLSHVAEEVFSGKPALDLVDLYNNPFHCDCALKWMPRVVLEGVSWARHWKDSGTPPECATPPHLTGIPITEMLEVDMTCDELQMERVSDENQATHLRQNMSFVARLSEGLPGSMWIAPDGEIFYPFGAVPGHRRWATTSVTADHTVTTSLLLDDCSLADQGRYTLIATNVVGNKSMTFDLEVYPYELTEPPSLETTEMAIGAAQTLSASGLCVSLCVWGLVIIGLDLVLRAS